VILGYWLLCFAHSALIVLPRRQLFWRTYIFLAFVLILAFKTVHCGS
jgi:hypothetical protein